MSVLIAFLKRFVIAVLFQGFIAFLLLPLMINHLKFFPIVLFLQQVGIWGTDMAFTSRRPGWRMIRIDGEDEHELVAWLFIIGVNCYVLGAYKFWSLHFQSQEPCLELSFHAGSVFTALFTIFYWFLCLYSSAFNAFEKFVYPDILATRQKNQQEREQRRQQRAEKQTQKKKEREEKRQHRSFSQRVNAIEKEHQQRITVIKKQNLNEHDSEMLLEIEETRRRIALENLGDDDYLKYESLS